MPFHSNFNRNSPAAFKLIYVESSGETMPESIRLIALSAVSHRVEKMAVLCQPRIAYRLLTFSRETFDQVMRVCNAAWRCEVIDPEQLSTPCTLTCLQR
jgi:hypothetical protein